MKTTPIWQPVDTQSQVWACSYLIPNFKSRTVAFLSRSDQLVIVGPGAALVDHPPPLGAREPAMILIPNAFHYMGVPVWQKKYPKIVLIASKQAQPRLFKKGIRNIQSLDRLRSELPENITLIEPQGMGYGEVWLRIQDKDDVIWIVCDSFFNHPRLSNKPIAKFMQKITQAAPGLKMSSVVKHFLIKNRQVYKKWLLEQLAQDAPSVLVPAHGDILRSKDLPDRIRQLILGRL